MTNTSQIKAIALDCGTTMIKCACLDEHHFLRHVHSTAAPKLTYKDHICESNPVHYLEKTTQLLDKNISKLPHNIPIGISAQRSTFVVWDRSTGHPISPLISWQDRRALDWCNDHLHKEDEIRKRTGLFLSPHYAGPKLAFLLNQDLSMRKGMLNGQVLFGTLESYLIWHWTKGSYHTTDPSMAARTLLFDVYRNTWSQDLLNIFNIPSSCLPQVRQNSQEPITLSNNRVVTATIADQSAVILSALNPSTDHIFVNLGTGVFVLRLTADGLVLKDGYLCSLVLGQNPNQFAIEGTMNGIARTLSEYPPIISALPDRDLYPNAFCLPDSTGIGSPYWRTHHAASFSSDAAHLSVQELSLIVLEGIIFRISEIIHDIGTIDRSGNIFLSGGLSRNALISKGLACTLDKAVCVLKEKESTLLGCAYLACAYDAEKPPLCDIVEPSGHHHFLKDKYQHWKKWMKSHIGSLDPKIT